MAGNDAIPVEEQQPTRRAVKEGTRKFDQTFLDPESDIIHRDYIAHAFRWGFAKGHFIEHDKSKVLDVGCGPDKPLFSILFGGIGGGSGGFPASYVGVDMNKIKATKHKRTTLYPNTNFFEQWEAILKAHGPFDLITNFEVIEHMPVAEGRQLLEIFRACLAPGGKVLLSTPVYDGKARARNHIHEYTIPELQGVIEMAQLRVVKRFGTFMNLNEVKKCATPAQKEVFEQLKAYFSADVLSNFLAPLHPDHARNNIWVLEADPDKMVAKKPKSKK